MLLLLLFHSDVQQPSHATGHKYDDMAKQLIFSRKSLHHDTTHLHGAVTANLPDGKMEHCHQAHSSRFTLAIGRGWSQELQSASLYPNNPAAYQRIIQNSYQLTKRYRSLLTSSSWSCLGIWSLGGLEAGVGISWHTVWNPLGFGRSPGCPCRPSPFSPIFSPTTQRRNTIYPRHGKGRKCHPRLIGWEQISVPGIASI